MHEQHKYEHEPWDNGVYTTGPIRPKKDRQILLALLLITVICLSGAVSLLGIANIRMFQKLQERKVHDVPISFAADAAAETEPMAVSETVAAITESAADTAGTLTIPLQEAPQADDNISQPGGLSFQEIYTRCIDSVVSITCTQYSGASTGTGVIISPDGYIVTNYHVIEGANVISLLLTDGRELEATVVGYDSISDLAVLHMEGENFTAAEFGDSDSLRVGDSVAAIGDPLGSRLRGTMTNGIVSAINRDVNVSGVTMNLIQTNAALNSGNSGGPLINCHGQVIGINTMKISAFTDNAGVEGIGFAIPSITVKHVVEQLIAQGYVSGRPHLGLEGEQLSGFYLHYYNMPAGLYITYVEAGSPADLGGVQAGDILLSMDGTEIRDMTRLTSLLYAHAVGDTVTLRLYRSGTIGSVQVTLSEATG